MRAFSPNSDLLPSDRELQEGLRALRNGQVIAHPTETVYGLAADPFSFPALEKILALKGRQESKGFILLIKDRADLSEIVASPSPLAQTFMEHFWPGPLTLIMPARPSVPDWVTGGRGSVAVRHSSSPHVAALLGVWGKPLVSTSANLSGSPPLTTGTRVRECFGSRIGCIMDGRCPTGSLPSTIVALDEEVPRIVRAGAVTIEMLRRVWPSMLP
ncbi:MAG: threonylcarbamoyl-AMP synthase [Magnetococcales bacterium]|nr:threonylcarbamoyl-AMP synthase [Magnetococcales bacterium]